MLKIKFTFKQFSMLKNYTNFSKERAVKRSDVYLSSTFFKLKTEVRVLNCKRVIGQCGEHVLRILGPH